MAKRQVVLSGNEFVIQNEDDKAGAAITPGMLVNWNGSGDVVAHAGAAGTVVAKTFAMERVEAGQDMDVPYATGDTVKVGHMRPGNVVNALVANGVNVAKGAHLESAGNGTLRAVTTGQVVGRAKEALNNTSGANARLRVEII